MQFENFAELYLKCCEILGEETKNYGHVLDLDDIYIKIKSNDELIISLLKKREILLYSEFLYKDKLPPDYDNIILVYPNMDKIIKLIEDMKDNENKHLNKWKLDNIEKVLILGWKSYCDIHIDFCIDKLYGIKYSSHS